MFHVALVGISDQLSNVLSSCVLTGAISSLDLELCLATFLFDHHVLVLDTFEFHCLHLDDESAAIVAPDIES